MSCELGADAASAEHAGDGDEYDRAQERDNDALQVEAGHHQVTPEDETANGSQPLLSAPAAGRRSSLIPPPPRPSMPVRQQPRPLRARPPLGCDRGHKRILRRRFRSQNAGCSAPDTDTKQSITSSPSHPSREVRTQRRRARRLDGPAHRGRRRAAKSRGAALHTQFALDAQHVLTHSTRQNKIGQAAAATQPVSQFTPPDV